MAFALNATHVANAANLAMVNLCNLYNVDKLIIKTNTLTPQS